MGDAGESGEERWWRLEHGGEEDWPDRRASTVPRVGRWRRWGAAPLLAGCGRAEARPAPLLVYEDLVQRILQ